MYKFFYKGKYIGTAHFHYGSWTACYLNENCAFCLKNKGAAKRWLIEQHQKYNVSVEAA